MMFADVARQLLTAAGKSCTARGASPSTRCRRRRRRCVPSSRARRPGPAAEDDGESEAPVTLGSRAWPFIDMLERTAPGRSQGQRGVAGGGGF